MARLDKEVDEDATEETRQSIIEQRKDDLYDETLDGWKEGIEWAVKEKVWDDVNFDNLFTTIKIQRQKARRSRQQSKKKTSKAQSFDVFL